MENNMKNNVCIYIYMHIYIREGNGTPLQYSCTPAWKIPRTEEPGRLQSMGSLGVGHDWVTSLPLFTFVHWRRKWQPTPVFMPKNPRDWGAWWAAVSGVPQSWTRLKRFSSSSRWGIVLSVFLISDFQSAEWSDNEFLLSQARRWRTLFWQLNKLIQSPHDFK